MYKIALIDPQSGYGNKYFPTGLSYLSSYIKEYSADTMDVKIFQIAAGNYEMVIDYQPHLIGLTAFTHTFGIVQDIASDLKKCNMHIPLVLGGQHLSMAPSSLPKIFDYGVIGEGEQSFLQLVEFIRKGGSEKSVLNGVQFWDDDVLHTNPPAVAIQPLDLIPFPDRNNFPAMESIITANYSRLFHKSGLRSMQLTTSRGCPFKCAFCQPSQMWGHFRMHSVDYSAEEIAYIHSKFGINAILIEDDLFTVNKKRVRELIDILAKRNLLNKIVYYVAARTEQIDDEWVQLFKELGVVKVEFGIESGSDRIAKYLKKSTATTEINKHAINLLNKAGISVYASFIVGAPPEERDDLAKTWKLIKWIQKNYVFNSSGVNLATPLPGTDLWNYAVEKSLIDPENVEWYKLATLAGIPKDVNNIVYLNEHIPAEKLLRILKYFFIRLWLGSPADFIKAIPRRIKKIPQKLGW